MMIKQKPHMTYFLSQTFEKERIWNKDDVMSCFLSLQNNLKFSLQKCLDCFFRIAFATFISKIVSRVANVFRTLKQGHTKYYKICALI